MLVALAGGILIGISAALLFGTVGRIAGISGIAFAALVGPDKSWRMMFLAGLIGGGWLAIAAGAKLPLASAPTTDFGFLLLIAAGLMVGFGTRLGSGCTSGHGVCGIARGSSRSIAAVITFMGIGVLSATFLRGLLS